VDLPHRRQRGAPASPAAARPAGAGRGEHERACRGSGRAALAALPERQRLALFLRYYADLDYAGIAEALGISRGTVSATLHAAHSKLQTQLTEVER
jgi:RNA polymerase sigma factor (sigma-70 family)